MKVLLSLDSHSGERGLFFLKSDEYMNRKIMEQKRELPKINFLNKTKRLGTRLTKTNPRALGTNPRAKKTNPRAIISDVRK
jgi:hypothetical protein